MDTNDLIRTLAADNDTHERSVGHLLLAALVLAVPVSTALFLTGLGVRSDVMTAVRNPMFDLKFAVTLALAAGAIVISLHLSRPEASLGRWAWLLPGCHSDAVTAVAGGGSDCLAPWRTVAAGCYRSVRRVAVSRAGGNALRCALHRRFTDVRGYVVLDRGCNRCGDRRARRFARLEILDSRDGRAESRAAIVLIEQVRSARCPAASGRSAAPVARLKGATCRS